VSRSGSTVTKTARTGLPKALIARQKYLLICANVLANVLLAERSRIVDLLAPDGVLVLSGILAEEFAGIQRAYEMLGLRLMAAKTEKEWRSGSFAWR
jgi:ribosomal protein L11 methylase PrmA